MFHYEKAWQEVMARIARAAQDAQRNPATVRLLAVGKTFPPDALRAVYAAGQRDFGENYVQEGVAKIDTLSDLPGIEWHLIGSLQSNKAAQAARHFGWVDTIDRMKIAERLARARPADLPPLNVCVEVNVSGEASKSGVVPAEALALAAAVAALPRLRLRGIMGIPEPTDDVARRRAQFRTLSDCFDACKAAGLPVDTLSMGMSSDFEDAIAEGATLVRVGTALFGHRAPL
jgi:PLP dependent protein